MQANEILENNHLPIYINAKRHWGGGFRVVKSYEFCFKLNVIELKFGMSKSY